MIAAGDGFFSFIASVATNGVGSAVAQVLTDEPEKLPQEARTHDAKTSSEPTADPPKAPSKPDGSATVHSAKRLAPTVQGYLLESARKEIKNAIARQQAIVHMKEYYSIETLKESAQTFKTVMQSSDTSEEFIELKNKVKKEFKGFLDNYDAAIKQLESAKENCGDPEGKLEHLIKVHTKGLDALREIYRSNTVDNNKPKTPGQPNGSSVPTERTQSARLHHKKALDPKYF